MKARVPAARSFGLAAVLLSTFGCQRTGERDPAMRPASSAESAESPARASTRSGVNEISSARCDREVRCGDVGPDRRYPSRDQCIADLNESTYDRAEEACPSGIDQTALSKCLSEIHKEKCGAPLDTLERLVACRPVSLCAE